MKGFWKEKKVFITGINGFVGANLAKSLAHQGASVYGLIRNYNPHSFLYFEKVNKIITLINGDITDFHLMKRIIAEEGIQHVFHLAAQVEVGTALEYPYLTWESNIRGTYTLLEAIREVKTDIKSIIIASSDKAYGSYPIEQLPYQESYPLKPEYPYDVSKACGDLIAQTYCSKKFNFPIIITRFANIYGPGQLNFSALIPDCIRSALGHGTFVPRTNGEHHRDFLFIKDVVDLYVLLAKKLSNDKSLNGQIFNAGSNDPIHIKSLIIKIFELILEQEAFTTFKRKIRFPKSKVHGEIIFQQMDFKKISENFKWRPQTKIDEGLRLSIDWYKKFLKNQNESSK